MKTNLMRDFLKLESSGGILLFAAAVLAIAIDNSPLAHAYQHMLAATFSLQIGTFVLGKSLLMWINEGLMAIFFLLVGLEIKREMVQGELSSRRKATLPVIAAIGGMLGPALVYLLFHWGHPAMMRGWAIPTATDIAFSLGILALLGSRVPVSLKIFLTALAIFDDIGGIVIIAGYYTQQLYLNMLLLALALIILLFVLNRMRVASRIPYTILGILLWFCMLKSGVHATLSGVILAWMIPLHSHKDPQYSPLKDLEHRLHPWVAFLILPLFAFANAGISFQGMHWNQLWQPLPLSIAMGLFIGKQIGILFSSWVGVYFKLAKKPHAATWMGIYGISMIAGVGFTMSLFIGGLAFNQAQHASYATLVRIGVIEGSLLSGIIGYLVLRFSYQSPTLMLPRD